MFEKCVLPDVFAPGGFYGILRSGHLPKKASNGLKGEKIMYQKYSIGKMSSLLGLSSEAIRYYESKDIIRPMRDPETGYRYYSTWDFHMLLRARYYQKCGFSLEEVSEMFRSRGLTPVADALGRREEDVEREIVYQMNLLKQIRQSRQMLEDVRDNVGKFKLGQRPGIYRINTQKNYTLFKDKQQLALISEWVEKEPFTFSCAVFYEKDIRDGVSRFDFGMGVSEEYAQYLHVSEGGPVQYYPPCLCVHTCVPSRSGKYLTLDSLEEGLAYLRQNGLALSGDVVTQVACMTKPDDEYFNWHIVWFPIHSA